MRINDPNGEKYFYYPEGVDVIYFKHNLDPQTAIDRPATKDDVERHPDVWSAFKPGKGKKKTIN